MGENDIYKVFNIKSEQLKTIVDDNLCNEYLKRYEEQTFILCGIPFKYMVKSNG